MISYKEYIEKHKKALVVMRGVPGSGKSFAAEKIHKEMGELGYSSRLYSTDEFFMKEGKYRWNPQQVRVAHQWNQNRAEKAMAEGVNVVIIDNTNTTWKEIKPYADYAKKHGYLFMTVEPNTEWANNADECFKRNQHNVPKHVIDAMLNRFEHSDDIIKKVKGNV